MTKLLALNRGEIAIRIMRAATELTLRTVAIYSKEDRLSLHRFKADEAWQIGEGLGPVQAYLDVENIVALAKDPAVDVTKLDAILKMQERLEVRQAEREFTAAFARLAGKLPRVKKNGTITLITKEGVNKGSIPFARWEDMDKMIRPLLVDEGFADDVQFLERPRVRFTLERICICYRAVKPGDLH